MVFAGRTWIMNPNPTRGFPLPSAPGRGRGEAQTRAGRGPGSPVSASAGALEAAVPGAAPGFRAPAVRDGGAPGSGAPAQSAARGPRRPGRLAPDGRVQLPSIHYRPLVIRAVLLFTFPGR